ncbi:MAG: hypothetical protein V9E81_17180 [Marmoricola sp.]
MTPIAPLPLPGGTPADVVLYDTPSAGRTTLIWNLGEWTPNTEIPNRRICTNTDPLAPNATSLVNHSEITFTGSPITPSDDHTVVLEQTGQVKLRKKVDAPLDVLNDDQKYTLSMQNFSDTLTIKAPTFIEVFPYNGDGSVPGGVNRSAGVELRWCAHADPWRTNGGGHGWGCLPRHLLLHDRRTGDDQPELEQQHLDLGARGGHL